MFRGILVLYTGASPTYFLSISYIRVNCIRQFLQIPTFLSLCFKNNPINIPPDYRSIIDTTIEKQYYFVTIYFLVHNPQTAIVPRQI